MPLPNAKQRLHVLNVHLRGESVDPVTVTQEALEGFAAKAEGLSGSDLFEICREAALRSLRTWLNHSALFGTNTNAATSEDSPPPLADPLATLPALENANA